MPGSLAAEAARAPRSEFVAPSEYAELKRRVRSAGLLAPQWTYYGWKAASTGIALGAVVWIALVSSQLWVLALDAMLLGFVMTQIGFLGHDVNHRQVFRRRLPQHVSSLLLGNVLMGISYSWWHLKHNRHHANPNHVEDDPDINLPMFAHSAEQIPERARIFRPVIALQAYLYFVIGALLFVSMRASSVVHLATVRPRYWFLEALGLAVHFALYGLLLTQLGSWEAVALFVLVSQVTFSVYNVAVFAPNHKGMEQISDATTLDFLRMQVLTSRNVRRGLFADFLYGGLNYQIEHHLFPTLPRNQLGRAQHIARAYCRERHISYHETTAAQSYREILGHLHRVGAPIRNGTA